jgi:hypothetical protein
MKNILISIWELPQNILGFILAKLVWKNKLEPINNLGLTTLYYLERTYAKKIYVVKKDYLKSLCSFSLGQRVILKSGSLKDTNTIKHECIGHSLQSRKYGWFYLPTVGIVSVIRNIYSRFKTIDYYAAWPENEADRLGGVVR